MGNGSSSDNKKKPKKSSHSTSDSKKLAYKRQFSLDDARVKQQTLLDFYSSSTYGNGSPSTGTAGTDGKSTEEKIQENINKAANAKFSAGVKLAQDEEHFDTLHKKDQLNDPNAPRRKGGNLPNSSGSLRPSGVLDVNKIVNTLDTEAADLQKSQSQSGKVYDPNGLHEKPIVWGYCELTRKQLDEDQAAFSTWTHPSEGLVHSWAVFDGHGGYEVALYCAQHFLKYVEKYHKTRKNGVEESEWPKLFKDIFVNFDKHIGTLNLRGGCTVVIVLLVQYRLIIANAGDARAIMSKWDGKAGQLSYDHTPMADYDRVVRLVKTEKYNAMISKYFRINDKHETLSDIQKLPVSEVKKAPLISRELEKSRLLATIGVARGFGDFNLTVFGFRNIPIKPFLSCEPWVNIVELKENEIGETDCLVVACDGVYDVLQNQDIIDKIRFELYFDQEMLPKRSLEKNKSKSISKTMTKSKSKSKSKDNKDSNHNKDTSIDFIPAKAPAVDNDSKIDSPDSIGNSSGNLRTATIKDPAGKVQTISLKPLSYDKLDELCNDLGRLAYKKGTLDDVSLFLIPLKQVFDCVH